MAVSLAYIEIRFIPVCNGAFAKLSLGLADSTATQSVFRADTLVLCNAMIDAAEMLTEQVRSYQIILRDAYVCLLYSCA